MSWCRLWDEMPNDPKWRTISRKSGQSIGNVIAVFVHMMSIASQSDEKGEIKSFIDEDVASSLDMETEDVAAIREAMQGRVLEGSTISGWERRQPKREDGSQERARRWRETKKQETNASERIRTHPNAEKRPDADADADSDADSENPSLVAGEAKGETVVGSQKRKSNGAAAPRPTFPPCPPWLPDHVWQSFVDHRKAKRKPLTPQAAVLALRDLDKARSFGHDPTALIETAIQSGWTGCVFEDRHFQPATPPQKSAPDTAETPMFSKVGNQQRRNIDAWLCRDNVIEGVIHERH